MSNPSLGRIQCPLCQTEGAQVRQTKRRGAHLYWQCIECGLNQPTGKKIQETLWRETDFDAGANPIRPANVTDGLERNTPTEFDPTATEPATEPETERPSEPQPSKAKGVGIFLLASLGLGVFLARK